MDRSEAPTVAEGQRADTRDTALPRVDGYEVLRVLGRGGGGVVYAARHLALGRIVALKTHTSRKLGAAALARFRLEAQVLASLAHPNIVQVFEVGEADAHPYFALEFVDGGSLANARLDWTPMATLMATVARAVHSAHERGVVHRDLKPGNILVTSDGVPKVADFGIAHRPAIDEAADAESLFGTPGYLAPEMVVRPWAATHLVDVFGLGATLYALIAGKPPFEGDTTTRVLLDTAFERPATPSTVRRDVPRDLESICLKAIERRPGDRYPSAAAFADDLERWLAGEPVVARRRTVFERVASWSRRNTVALMLLVATVFGAACSIDYMSSKATQLARETALLGASQQIDTLERITDYYTDHVVGNAPLTVTSTRYREQPGTIPVPATFTIELGDIISGAHDGAQEVRMYSDLPFAHRKNGGPRNDFERDALVALRARPDEPFYAFESMPDGRLVLRYARARVLRERCVECHNRHEESPRTDWKVGDVRGALEVVRSLDPEIQRSRTALAGASVMLVAFSALIGLLAVGSVVTNSITRRKPRRPGG